MKTGMNLLLWSTHVTAEHFPLFAKLKAAGFDGVEVPLFEGHAAHYKTLRKELDKHGLGCTTVTCVGPEVSPISADAAIRRAAVERRLADVVVGADRVVVRVGDGDGCAAEAVVVQLLADGLVVGRVAGEQRQLDAVEAGLFELGQEGEVLARDVAGPEEQVHAVLHRRDSR